MTFAEEALQPADRGRRSRLKPIVIPNRTGLHARPAAVLANLAKSFQSAIKLQLGDRQANARSVTAIMALEVAYGQRCRWWPRARCGGGREKLSACWLRAAATRAAYRRPRRRPQPISPGRRAGSRRKSADPNLLIGVAASPGLAVGEVFQVRRKEIEVVEDGHGVDAERRRLAAAIAAAQGQLGALRAQLHAKADPAKAAIFAAHEELLADPDMLEIAESAIAKGKSAAFALEEGGHDPRGPAGGTAQSTARAARNDLRDVGLRVLSILTGRRPSRRSIRRTPCSSPKISRRPIPRRWIARA